jgi:predicted amidophosphoribosyltransferase
MPAPSSLWSRWRGAHDLAFILAEALAVQSHRLLYSPPWSLRLRWQKQALRSRKDRRQVFRNERRLFDPSYFYAVIPKEKRGQKLSVLIVDDIVTSANTLIQLAGRFRDLDFNFFTLASAYSVRSDRKLDLASATCK